MLLTYRDVAIIFHAHCLSPHRYYEDMFYRKQDSMLWNMGISFPLERLHNLIVSDAWSDPFSQRVWEEFLPTFPYQLWSAQPEKNGVLQLQDVRWECPWCKEITTIELEEFTRIYSKESNCCACTGCGVWFNVDLISAKYLVTDLSEFRLTRDVWFCALRV